MNSLVNEYGNIADDEYREFETAIGQKVETYFMALIARGVSPGEIRVVNHYLMAYLHMIESRVLLRRQRQASRTGANSTALAGEAMLKDLGMKLDDRIENMRRLG